MILALLAVLATPPSQADSHPKRKLSAHAAVLSGAPTSADYPRSAIRSEAQGPTKIAFRITAEGRAVGCRIVQSSSSSQLDWLACGIAINRMRFKPAIDLDGKPTWQDVILPVTWVIAN